MKTIIVGIPGVGKTTVIEKAKKKLSEYQTINFGTKMLETARKQGLVENRDQLRKLSPKKTKKLQKKTAKEIKKKKNLLIDTHLAIESKKGITPGMPKWIVEKINLDRVILIEAEPEKIKERRKKDKTRKRNDFKLTPKQHQKINRYYAATISTLTGAPVKIIKNRENQAEKAANEMIKTLKK
ncbi:MAG: adenylate kinase [archaeon]